MHARHRSPGNGYRSSPMGMGGAAAASQISPEGSMRGHGMYNSEHRNYNRGFGRGQPKPFQPPPRKGDIFMEAGRLATEYLASKGLLPQNELSGKWQNGSSKNHIGDFQGFRPQEGENLHLPPEVRTSALARLGNVVPDAGPGRRRFPDDYNSTGSRNYMRGRRRMGSFKNYGSDWSREIGRSGSWFDRDKFSPDMECDDDPFSGDQEEQQVNKDIGSGVQKSHLSELAPKSDVAVDSDSALEKCQFLDDMGSKASSYSTGKDLPPETNAEVTKGSDDFKVSNMGTGEVKDGTSNDETEKKIATEDVPIQHCAVGGDSGTKNGSDLLSLCRFAKVPTKTRSSLTVKGSKVDTVPIIEDENNHDIRLPRGSGVSIVDVPVDGSSGDAQSNEIQSPKCLDPDMLKAPSVTSAEDAGELGSAYAVELGKCTRSRSFPERSFMNEQELSEGSPGFGRSSSMIMEKGEKRAGQHSDSGEGSKKPREWVPSKVTQADEYSHLSNLREKQLIAQEGRTSPGEEVILESDQERSVDSSLFPKSGAEPCIEYAEEKQFFPGSFKICDLNLMEASEVNENHDILFIPSIPESKKEASVDIDLSISNNCNMTDKYGRRGADGKIVEVIDLENDSVQEDKGFNNSDRKAEMVFTGLENFPNHAQNTSDIPDVQDGYGLMIPELLGTDISNCSSVPADMSSLHNEMGLHNGEGILGDDESIYMSLGEIPISLLRVWEQPTQEYEKPF
uniref:Uncharacterized protein n=1 Tax=Davidia involucrata TaxID=16924 RepID=A0A5B7AK00_DAVIN